MGQLDHFEQAVCRRGPSRVPFRARGARSGNPEPFRSGHFRLTCPVGHTRASRRKQLQNRHTPVRIRSWPRGFRGFVVRRGFTKTIPETIRRPRRRGGSRTRSFVRVLGPAPVWTGDATCWMRNRRPQAGTEGSGRCDRLAWPRPRCGATARLAGGEGADAGDISLVGGRATPLV